MQAEIAVRALLLQASAVTSLVGDRIYPRELPLGVELPGLVTEHISTAPGQVVAPVHGSAPSVERSRIRVHAVADTYHAVQQLLAATRSALHGYRGSAGGVRVGHVGADLVGPPLHDDGGQAHTQSLDVIVITHPS